MHVHIVYDNKQTEIGSNHLEVLGMLVCGFIGFIVNPLMYCKNTKDAHVSLLHRKGVHESGTYSLEPTDQNLSRGNGTQCSLPAADPCELYLWSLLSRCWGGLYLFFPGSVP